MASGGQFPPQKQGSQPGKEHLMDPSPQHVSHDYKPANKLHGKVALVTGGDSGIGRAVCNYFAMEDLGFDEKCKRVVDEVVNVFGRIDVLVNNAAEQYKASTVEDIDEERLERVFRTNIFAYFFMARHALKHMREGSTIINTTSINAYKGNAKLLDYTATKGAIVAFTRGLSLQLVSKGIRVNGVAPGPVWTPLIPASFDEEEMKQFGSEVPMKRAAQPSEIATAYVFLASNDSSYYSGQVLHPNGGAIVNG
ncbi:Dormancy protein 1 [Heracleum sosnowskyi]|uniref:Dormancy protein 1 n=1 Tax=Heracleum sosnowskyi TaxID=360622 RepID=A0AAD8JEG6_9APIA|nr:Dormancy protein 1 [Heracleum sosnowskyi]